MSIYQDVHDAIIRKLGDPAAMAEAAIKAMGSQFEFRIAKLQLEPGDLLVLKVKDRIPASGVDRIRGMMVAASGGHKVLVLEGGAELAVLTAAQQVSEARAS